MLGITQDFSTIPIHIKPNRPWGYEWVCISDPSGDFWHNLFRLTDIKPRNSFDDIWEYSDGTTFIHIGIPEIKRIEGGKVKTDFIMTGECDTGWQLYHAWCMVYQAAAENGNEPERNPQQKAALQTLREHLKTCPVCIAAVKRLVKIGEENHAQPEIDDHEL